MYAYDYPVPNQFLFQGSIVTLLCLSRECCDKDINCFSILLVDPPIEHCSLVYIVPSFNDVGVKLILNDLVILFCEGKCIKDIIAFT